MKKLYIQPRMMCQSMNSVTRICVASVRGGKVQSGGEIPIPAEFNPM